MHMYLWLYVYTHTFEHDSAIGLQIHKFPGLNFQFFSLFWKGMVLEIALVQV